MKTGTGYLSGLSLLLVAACGSSGAPASHADHQAHSAQHADHKAHTASTPKPAEPPAQAAPDAPPAAAQAALTKVDDTSTVCMVNNTYMGRPQIPVQVEGRTYFGCCDMCKGRLERDPSSRVATDPVSGRAVDKSAAVIGKDAQNRVFYFENEATYKRYAGT